MIELQALQRELRELRREMKDHGIRHISCINGGLDTQTYRANARVFELETKIKDLKQGREVKA